MRNLLALPSERTLFDGLPYIPRVHLSEGSLVRSPLKWLWSEEPMVRRSFIPKFLYSESCYVPKIPYSERPSTIWILCYEDSLVRSSSSPKSAMFRTSIFRKSPSSYGFYITKVIESEVPPVLRLLCSEDSIFRTSPVVYGFCVTKVLPDDILIFRGTKYYNIGTVYLFCYNEAISEVFH